MISMQRKEWKMYKLPEGEYTIGFIQWFACAIYCQVITPVELVELMTKLSNDELAKIFENRVRVYRMKNAGS